MIINTRYNSYIEVSILSYRGEQKIKGKTYVYEAFAHWDKDKKHSVQKRIYIGTKDEVSGNFIPNNKYYELYGTKQKTDTEHPIPSIIKTDDYGDVYLLRQIANVTGLSGVLKNVFPSTHKELLACAVFLIATKSALHLCKQWIESVCDFEGLKLSSQRISALLQSLDENSRMNFYRQWASLRQDKEYLAFDITSISSYSELIDYVEQGYNRDLEDLPQVNLGMLFGENSKLPVFCRLYPGSIRDVSTLTGMIQFMSILKLCRMHYVMDKGFYSEKGIAPLLEQRIKFSIGVPFTTLLATNAVRDCAAGILAPSNAIEVNGQLLYAVTRTLTLKSRRVYLHVYLDEQRQSAKRSNFMKKLLRLEEGLRSGAIKLRGNKIAKKYLSCRKSKNGVHIRRKVQAIEEDTALYGFFVILTNDSKDPRYVLDIYRTKDVIEKSFDNLKNDLDLNRLNVHSDAAMEGRVFLGFISLILSSYIRETMRQNNLYKSFTFSSLLAELKKQKMVHFSGGKTMLTELSKTQRTIFEAFHIAPPT